MVITRTRSAARCGWGWGPNSFLTAAAASPSRGPWRLSGLRRGGGRGRAAPPHRQSSMSVTLELNLPPCRRPCCSCQIHAASSLLGVGCFSPHVRHAARHCSVVVMTCSDRLLDAGTASPWTRRVGRRSSAPRDLTRAAPRPSGLARRSVLAVGRCAGRAPCVMP
jgi:hypothetical protein